MKTFLILPAFALALAASAQSRAGLIVGWETWASGSEAASSTDGDATGVGNEVSGDWREATQAASNDGTFGNLAGASTSTASASTGTFIGGFGISGTYDFTVTAGLNGLILETFHFDAQRKRANSPEFWSVTTLSGAISTGVTVGMGTLTTPSLSQNHADFDLDLTSLTDNVLEPGESATFRMSFTGGNNTNTDQITFLDNVAISGTSVPPTPLVPEPTSLAIAGLSLLGLLRCRASQQRN